MSFQLAPPQVINFGSNLLEFEVCTCTSSDEAFFVSPPTTLRSPQKDSPGTGRVTATDDQFGNQ